MAAVALFAFFGVWLCLEGIGNIRRAAASAHWPKTEGSVTRSVAVASTSHNRADRTSSISYSADLEFRYLVNGASHATSLRHFGQLEGSTDSSEAELLRRRYPEGARVPIYYDPANPASAVTEPGFHADMLWLPSAGIFLLLPSLMFAAFLFGDSSPGEFDFGIVVFGGLFASLGLIGVLYGGIQIERANEAVNWPRAKGEIVYDQIDSSTSVTKEEGRQRGRPPMALTWCSDTSWPGKRTSPISGASDNWPGRAKIGPPISRRAIRKARRFQCSIRR